MSETLGQLISRRLSELDMKKADLARAVGKSTAYIGDLANDTGKTKSGKYIPSPAIATKLAKALKIKEVDILIAVGYLSEDSTAVKTLKEVTTWTESWSDSDAVGFTENLGQAVKSAAVWNNSQREMFLRMIRDSALAVSEVLAENNWRYLRVGSAAHSLPLLNPADSIEQEKAG